MTTVISPASGIRRAFVPSTRRYGITGTTRMRGRDAEWRVVRELLRRARIGSGRVLLVDGERGMGRSLLLREAGHEGARQGFSLATGAADRLLGGQLPLFALRMAVGFAGDEDDPPEPGLVSAQIGKLRERLMRRAETGPVLVTLDDLQWASRETLLALRVLPCELARHPIAWILTRSASSREAGAASLFTVLEREGAFQVSLRPLDTDVVTAMLTSAFGAPPDEDLRELAAGAGGNLSLLSDLIDGLREDKIVRVADDRACLASARLPRRISRAVRQWLDVSESAQRLLETTAVLGGEFRLSDVAEVMGTAPTALLPSVNEALDAGVIVAGDDTFSFRHHLLARAVAESVPRPVRRVLHRQFGEILLSREGSAAEAAGHLMNGTAPGDPASLAGLDSAVGRILHWSPRGAADLALRALQCTSPADPAATPRAVAAVESLTAAGRPRQATRIAHETLAQAVAVRLEMRLRCALASALNMSGQAGDAAAQADKVLNSRDPHGMRDDALTAWLQAATARHDERIGPLTAGLLASPDEHAGYVVAAAGTVRAMLKWDEGRGGEALALLHATARQSGGISPDARHSQPLLLLAARMIDLRRLDEAAEMIQPADDKRAHGGLAVIVLSLLRARLHLARGQLVDAGSEAGAALDAAESAGADAYASVARSLLASAALRQGRVNDAARHVASRAVLPPHAAAVYAPAETCLAPAQVAAASGDPSAATGQILELCADPPALRRVLLGDPALAVWLVRTALAGGERPLAARIATTIETLSSPDTPAMDAAVAHARGLLAKDGNSLADAAARHADPWARASAAEDLAVLDVSATARDEAVGRLNEALEGYAKTGATADLARVRARLRGLGIRRRHWETSLDRPVDGWESLTGTERAVAELIAQGLTNRQAAERMYISMHTVAHHLRQAFRKLGIGSRVELARIVVERSPQAAE
jgi:DNA-binding CsgD family transcriptional regulator